jgi:hypothetical protein
MAVAVKYGWLTDEPIITPDGSLVTTDGGVTVARRVLGMYPGAVLLGTSRGTADGFEVRTIEDLDPSTLVINLDVIDSVGVFQRLHRTGAEPRIMNFQWINPSTFHHPVNFAAMGLSYAMFPTFCAGERTAGEVREVARKWTVPTLADRVRVAWADLGVRAEMVRPRQSTDIPVVLYPAISTIARKQPQAFVEIVEAVAKQTPIRVHARLNTTALASETAMYLSRQKWATVQPLAKGREEYWDELSRVTAYVATATEEAYGLEYVEALMAGAVGILPDRPWARRLVPEGYPFLYEGKTQAEQMLLRAVTSPDQCRAEVDAVAARALGSSTTSGALQAWIQENHNVADFDEQFKAQVAEWFGQ